MASCNINFCKDLINQFTKLDISEQKQIEKEINDIADLLAKELELKGNSGDAQIVKKAVNGMQLRSRFVEYKNIGGGSKKEKENEKNKRKIKAKFSKKNYKHYKNKTLKNKRKMHGGVDLSVKILAFSLTAALVASLSLGDISISGGLWSPIEGFLISKGLMPSLCSDYNIIWGFREYVAPKFGFNSCSAIKMRYDIIFHSLRTILLTSGFYTLLSSRRHISDLYNYVLAVLGRLVPSRKRKLDDDEPSSTAQEQELSQENIETIAKEEEQVLTANLDEVESKAVENAALDKAEIKEEILDNPAQEQKQEQQEQEQQEQKQKEDIILTPEDVIQSSTSPEDIIPIPQEIASEVAEETLQDTLGDVLLEATELIGGKRKHKTRKHKQKKLKKEPRFLLKSSFSRKL